MRAPKLLLQVAACLSLMVPVFAGDATATTSTSDSAMGLAILPVVPCPTSYGIPQSDLWRPTKLTADVSTGDARRLAFYSNGYFTLLGPRGWACQGGNGANGSDTFAVYPIDQGPPTSGALNDASQSIVADRDYTGHGPGALLVCPFFPDSPAADFFHGGPPSCTPLPSGTTLARPTDDIVEFKTAAQRSGTVIYPQMSVEPSGGVEVALASCHISGKRARLCDAILRDFEVRSYPPPPNPNLTN